MITVTTLTGQRHRYPTASAWHIDDKGDLHVRENGAGNVASYAHSLWASVAKTGAESDDDAAR